MVRKRPSSAKRRRSSANRRPSNAKRPAGRQNAVSPRVAAASEGKDKLPTSSTALVADETASKTKNPQSRKNNNKPNRLLKFLFGSRLRKLVTGITTLVIAPAIAAIIAEPVNHLLSRPSESATQAIVYEPWNTNTNNIALSNVRINRTASGSCWTSSIVTNRPDAYRCVFANNKYIIDPCFAYPFRPPSELKEVACPSPDPDSITIIRLTRPLPQVTAGKGKFPLRTDYWFIVLADGTKCFAGGGTVDLVGNEEGAYYYCPGIGFPLYGYPDTSGQIWTILEQRSGAPGMEPVPIAKAYR